MREAIPSIAIVGNTQMKKEVKAKKYRGTVMGTPGVSKIMKRKEKTIFTKGNNSAISY